jgi:hypothetical protein
MTSATMCCLYPACGFGACQQAIANRMALLGFRVGADVLGGRALVVNAMR